MAVGRFAWMIWLLAAVPAHAEQDAVEIGDSDRGAALFDDCSACHQVGAGAQDGIGPHLNGIFGRKAAANDGFPYSDGILRASRDGLIWDLRRLDAYIENPKALVSGTRMNYDGLKDATDRADVLAYLRVYSDNPSDIPEAQPTARSREVELSPETLAIVGDAEYGEYLSSECTGCHQRDGSADGIPSITQWPTEDFMVAMHAYKRKIRPHPVMQMMAGRLSDEEIASLAVYFETLD